MVDGREPKTRHTSRQMAPPSFIKWAMAEIQKLATDIRHGQFLITLV
jgi:hypothetical protein